MGGSYITNDAVSRVAQTSNDTAGYTKLILSWKSTKPVPIDQASLGIMGSIFSKVKKGYNYVTGNDSAGIGAIENVDSATNENSSLIPYTMSAFFHEATARLKEHPSHENKVKLLQPLENSTSDYNVPVSLDDHRQLLLKLQLHALEDTVSRVSEERSTSITGKEIQEHLRAAGNEDFRCITDDDGVKSQLLDQINAMNENARMAFARSVLWSEFQWMQNEPKLHDDTLDYTQTRRKLHQKGDQISMSREAILEFCGLCNNLVKLPEVEDHLRSGKAVFGVDDAKEEYLVPDNLTAPSRVLQLQQMMLCAVGFEPTFGAEELHRVMTKDLNEKRDKELEGSLASYLMTMQVTAKNAMDEGLNQGFSDESEGGVTKVISVKYSEKTLNRNINGEEVEVGDVAPSHARMEQQSDEQEREQLKMAARAATLQQSILDKLNSMEEHERQRELGKAKEMHELFVQKTMALPPGPERVSYLQSISGDQQYLLLMHKLWETKKRSDP